MIKYSVDEFVQGADGELDLNNLANYDVKNGSSTNSPIQTMDNFKFSGVSFACSFSGVIACVAAFGGLAFYIPVAGVSLAAACELAFMVGCAIS